jgi:N-acetyltransferase B complex (NatB) non catalytic subunit
MLDIKQIQHDTLSHILFPRISTLYNNQIVLYQLSIALSIYHSNEDETPSQIFPSFKEGTYHNIPDFWELWMRLRNSLTKETLLRERDFVNWSNGENVSRFESISEDLWDQRDLKLMMNCEIKNESPENFTRIGPIQGVYTLFIKKKVD